MTGGVVSANSMKQFDLAPDPKTACRFRQSETAPEYLPHWRYQDRDIFFNRATYPQPLNASTFGCFLPHSNQTAFVTAE
jgi:hypothetical protein